MKPLANYLLKTAAVTAIAVGMSMAFASSASADETLTDITFEDQVDPAYVEYLLELGSDLATDTLTPEEENLREEAERAALDAALEGFDERLAILTDEVFHSEFDGGVKSWRKGIIYYSTTQAGFEYLSNKYKSMIDDGYLVLDATFDMRWPTEESNLSSVEPIELEIPVLHPEFGLDQQGLDMLLGLFESEMGAHLEFDGMVQKSRDDKFSLSTTEAGYKFYSIRFKRLVDSGLLVIDTKFDMRWLTDAEARAAYVATTSKASEAIEQDDKVSNSEPTEPILEDEQEISYPAIEPALTSQAEESTVTWFAYGPEGTENGIDWSRLYYQFALLSMLTLPQPGSSLGVTSGLLGSGQ